MEDKVINIENKIPHIVRECICLNCKYRYIASHPLETWLRVLECPSCHMTGFVIDTGEIIEDEEE